MKVRVTYKCTGHVAACPSAQQAMQLWAFSLLANALRMALRHWARKWPIEVVLMVSAAVPLINLFCWLLLHLYLLDYCLSSQVSYIFVFFYNLLTFNPFIYIIIWKKGQNSGQCLCAPMKFIIIVILILKYIFLKIITWRMCIY